MKRCRTFRPPTVGHLTILLLGVLCLASACAAPEVATVQLVDTPEALDLDGYTVHIWALEESGGGSRQGIIQAPGQGDEPTSDCDVARLDDPDIDCEMYPAFASVSGDAETVGRPNSDGRIELPPVDYYRKVRVVWPEWVDECRLGGETVLRPGADSANIAIDFLACV